MEVCKLSRLMVYLAVLLVGLCVGLNQGEASDDSSVELRRAKRYITRKHYTRHYMTDYHGRTIHLTEMAQLLSLHRHDSSVPASFRSTVTVRAPKGHVVRVQFLKRGPPFIPPPGICNQRMFIFDGLPNSFRGMIHDAMRPLCGDSGHSDFISSGEPITLQFHNDGMPLPGRHGFTASLTPIRMTGCLKGDFHCSNGYCINKFLSCDGYNNCGDRSDELKCYVARAAVGMRTLSYLQLAIIILACVGVVILIGMLIWYIVSQTPCSDEKDKNEYQYIDSPSDNKWNEKLYP